MSAAAAAAAVASPNKSEGGGEDAELPKALLKRILKARLAEWDAQQNGGDGSRDFQINKVRARPAGSLPWKRRLAVWRCQSRSLRHAPRLAAPTFQLGCIGLQDALMACSEAAKLFIHYLAATASDVCKDAKRQTISAGGRAGEALGVCRYVA